MLGAHLKYSGCMVELWSAYGGITSLFSFNFSSDHRQSSTRAAGLVTILSPLVNPHQICGKKGEAVVFSKSQWRFAGGSFQVAEIWRFYTVVWCWSSCRHMTSMPCLWSFCASGGGRWTGRAYRWARDGWCRVSIKMIKMIKLSDGLWAFTNFIYDFIFYHPQDLTSETYRMDPNGFSFSTGNL